MLDRVVLGEVDGWLAGTIENDDRVAGGAQRGDDGAADGAGAAGDGGDAGYG